MRKKLTDCIFECKKCGHTWLARKQETPTICPKCRSSKWNGEKKYTHVCKRCNKTWESAIASPIECYHCHSVLWDVEYKKYKSLGDIYEEVGGDENFRLNN